MRGSRTYLNIDLLDVSHGPISCPGSQTPVLMPVVSTIRFNSYYGSRLRFIVESPICLPGLQPGRLILKPYRRSRPIFTKQFTGGSTSAPRWVYCSVSPIRRRRMLTTIISRTSWPQPGHKNLSTNW